MIFLKSRVEEFIFSGDPKQLLCLFDKSGLRPGESWPGDALFLS